MTLTDAGPLIALIDRGEVAHERCVAALEIRCRTRLVSRHILRILARNSAASRLASP